MHATSTSTYHGHGENEGGEYGDGDGGEGGLDGPEDEGGACLWLLSRGVGLEGVGQRVSITEKKENTK